ncbi:hypothetical protein BpJC7_26510 [Weizmannia acidilactici]|uniref:Uncharacterized protein n=1 Tax=Weizmannia acidilactici TaxID=2607726 RepID=A0A5J4JLB1_9BACI|nr:hypothetical protein [Weizmannia acidilactici]GER68273.1 hypothetical protein BpJC4_27440 [Weizmannia acidilactici]GER71348.1 hypothetical protein BpJC7_26510 [Weizmannia acidilactici]
MEKMSSQLTTAQSQISAGLAENLALAMIDTQVQQADDLVEKVAKQANPTISDDQIKQLQQSAENRIKSQQQTIITSSNQRRIKRFV